MGALNLYSVTESSLPKLRSFLAGAGDISQFRYYDTRPLEAALHHRACLLLEWRDTPIAYGHLDDDGEHLWLGVCVAESSRGLGWGTYMLQTLLQTASGLGLSTIRLSVDHENENARSLYERHGFTVVKSRSYYLIMERSRK